MIYNVRSRIMNTYVYSSTAGCVMIDTGYEQELAKYKSEISKIKLRKLK